MRIAIVGSGIAGLTVAHRLHHRHEVVIFERRARVGGHVNTIDVEVADRIHRVETGFVVFNQVNFPNFSRLLRQLRVPTRSTEMSLSVRHDPSGLEYGGGSLNALLGQRRNLLRPAFYRMLAGIYRFNRDNRATGPGLDIGQGPLAEYVAARGYGCEFFEYYLVPLGSSLWSAPPQQFRGFPSRFVVDFLRNHRLLQVGGRPRYRFVVGGADRYVEALVAGFRNSIRTDRAIRRVRRHPDFIEIEDRWGNIERFDQIVMACHADEALALLQDPDSREVDLLGSFPYRDNDVVLHSDTSVLPRNRRIWAAWNFHQPARGSDSVRITYNMNILQRLPGPGVFNVTLNDPGGIAPDRVLARLRYSHPQYGPRTAIAQSRHHELIGFRRTSYCGAYWGYGFHEDAVASGLAVAAAIAKL